jgi:hypothetical protein
MRRIAHPVLKKLLERGARLGERRQTVANVPGRQHAKLAAELPGTPAIVGDRHDCRNRIVGHWASIRGQGAQSLQYRGEARAAADGDDPRRGVALVVRSVCD